jgi:hypothetical protein
MQDFMRSLVRGYVWKAKMSNDAVFQIWTPCKLARKTAKSLLLKEANGDYGEVYASEDVENFWETQHG